MALTLMNGVKLTFSQSDGHSGKERKKSAARVFRVFQASPSECPSPHHGSCAADGSLPAYPNIRLLCISFHMRAGAPPPRPRSGHGGAPLGNSTRARAEGVAQARARERGGARAAHKAAMEDGPEREVVYENTYIQGPDGYGQVRPNAALSPSPRARETETALEVLGCAPARRLSSRRSGWQYRKLGESEGLKDAGRRSSAAQCPVSAHVHTNAGMSDPTSPVAAAAADVVGSQHAFALSTRCGGTQGGAGPLTSAGGLP